MKITPLIGGGLQLDCMTLDMASLTKKKTLNGYLTNREGLSFLFTLHTLHKVWQMLPVNSPQQALGWRQGMVQVTTALCHWEWALENASAGDIVCSLRRQPREQPSHLQEPHMKTSWKHQLEKDQHSIPSHIH